MYRTLSLLGLGAVVLFSGCAICASPDDEAYAAYGGVSEREDRCCGRVGSLLTGAGAPLGRLSPPVAVPGQQPDAPPPRRDESAEDVPPDPDSDSTDPDADPDADADTLGGTEDET